MSAIEIAMDKVAMDKTVSSPTVVSSLRLSDRVADLAIRLADWIAGDERTADSRSELAGNPWARPIGLGPSR